VCVYTLSYPVRKLRVPYYIVICGWYGSTTFFPYDLISGKIFKTKVIEQNMCDVLATNLSEIYLILRRMQRNVTINVHTSSRTAPAILARFQ